MSYDITLTQFSNYLTKTSRQKATELRNIALSLAEEYQAKTDYWLHLRNGVRSILSKGGNSSDLDSILEDVQYDRLDNYRIMIEGLKKYWKSKVFKKVSIPKRTWQHSQIRIKVNFEIAGEYRNTIYLIKFFTHAHTTIRKDECDMMLYLMHEAYKKDIDHLEKDRRKVILGVLDVSKGKLHTYRPVKDEITDIVNMEAEVLSKYLSKVD